MGKEREKGGKKERMESSGTNSAPRHITARSSREKRHSNPKISMPLFHCISPWFCPYSPLTIESSTKLNGKYKSK